MSTAARTAFADLKTRTDVAAFLGTSLKQLTFLLHARPEAIRYRSFTIPKRRGGTRRILAPRDDLKSVQTRLAARLNAVYTPRESVYGFVADKNIADNADEHVASRFVLNVDLKDFFPSIHFGRVRGLFLALKAEPEAATALAQICCHRGELPQGAPTSPVLSNMVCLRMDRELVALARKYNCRYSRYADDLSFSRKRGAFPPELAHLDEADGRAILGKELRDVIEKNGFTPHPDKTWLFNRQHRQMVTGLVVNAKRNVPRQFVRQLRAMIHAWEKFGLEKAQADYTAKYWRGPEGGEPPPFKSVVRGKMEFLKMVKGMRDGVYRRLQQSLVTADPDYFDVMEKENSLMDSRDVFVSHASEDKAELARPLVDLLLKGGLTVWYDEFDISIGDDIRVQIDKGLRNSRFGVVLLSPNFFKVTKTWTRREHSAFLALEDVTKQDRLIPVWHNITKEQVSEKSPTIAALSAAVTGQEPLDAIAKKIVAKVRKAQADDAAG